MSQAEDILKAELLKAQETIAEQREVLEQLTQPAFRYATIVSVNEERLQATVIMGGEVAVIAALKDHMQFKRGDTVLINKQGYIQEKLDPLLTGTPSVVQAVDKEWVELSGMGGSHVALIGEGVGALKSGDKVLTDSSGYVVIHRMPEADKARFAFTETTDITWDSIGGQTEAKEQMIEAVELPLKQSRVYDFYGKPKVKGILLYGPPGCGKTMLAKATATAIAKAYSQEAVSGFMYVKGPELLDPFVGVSESNIRNLFSRARAHKSKHGTQAVIFIDEADALLGSRGGNRHSVSDMEKTIVPSFLTEMDGLEESAALVILATNRPSDLDPAVVREGRIDRKIRVSRPDVKGALEIFKIHLQNVRLADGLSVD
jgi:proteasome-associated ATPase